MKENVSRYFNINKELENIPAKRFKVLPWGTSLFGLRPFYKNGERLSRKSATEAFAAAAAVT